MNIITLFEYFCDKKPFSIGDISLENITDLHIDIVSYLYRRLKEERNNYREMVVEKRKEQDALKVRYRHGFCSIRSGPKLLYGIKIQVAPGG